MTSVKKIHSESPRGVEQVYDLKNKCPNAQVKQNQISSARLEN